MILSSAFLLLFSIVAQAQDNGLTVNTQQGKVSGTLSDPAVRQFLGIPFATARRWQAPQTPPARNQVFQATSFGDSCVQQLDVVNLAVLEVANISPNVSESEDCLSVNIWSPSVKRHQGTAVLIWVYGGSFDFGTSNISIYSGSNLVRDNEDITIVSFNYRMNIFGQPNAPQLVTNSSSQNFGLLDLDAAVKWVHDNIANFGGDPERIVIFGESAGSEAVDAYTFAHPDDKIVKGVIQQSGSVSGQNTSTVVTPVNLDPTPWNTVAKAVGCGTNATPEQLTCMQAVPFRTLENAVISTGAEFVHVVDNINTFSDTAARAAAGNFLRVPVLAGTTQHEDDVFLSVQQSLSFGFVVPAIGEMLSDVQTLAGATCSVGFTALNRLKNNVPFWRYQYQGIFPDISNKPELRAFHGSEIPLVFGTYNVKALPPTKEEIQLSKFMQGAWVAFARDPTKGLSNLGWPVYNPKTASLAQLGNPANVTGMVFTKGALVDLACSQMGVLENIAAELSGLLQLAASL